MRGLPPSIGRLNAEQLLLQLTFFSIGCWNTVLAQAANTPVTAIAVSEDGQRVYSTFENTIRLHEGQSLETRRLAQLPFAKAHGLLLDESQGRIIVVGGVPGQSGGICVVSTEDLIVQRDWSAGPDVIYSAVLAANEELVLVSHDRSLSVTSIAAIGETPPVDRIAVYSKPMTDIRKLTEDLVVTSSADQTIRVWNISTREQIRTLNNHQKAVRLLAVRPASDVVSLPFLASASDDRTVRFWQPTIGRMVRFKRLPAGVNALCWTSPGEQAVAGCRDGFVYFIDPDSLEMARSEQITNGWVTAVATSPGFDDVLVGTSEGQVKWLTQP